MHYFECVCFWFRSTAIVQYMLYRILGIAMSLFILSIQPSPQNKFILQNDMAKLGDAVLIPSWASIIITCYN
jgi:hypothetical protein